MQAIILAGGKGKRMHPYTLVIPKPLLPINDSPIMEIILKQLQKSGFNHVKVAIGYLGQLISTYFGDGSRFGISMEYSLEQEPLGTIGPLTLMDNLNDNFLVLNGDTLTDLNYADLFNNHCDSKASITIATYEKKVKIDLGVLELDESMHLRDYIEKPTLTYNVSMGIYVLNKKVLTYIEKNKYFDFPSLVKLILSKGEKVNIYKHSGIWHDLGSVENFDVALNDFNVFERRS